MGAVIRIDVQYDVGEPGIFKIEVEDSGCHGLPRSTAQERLAAAVQGPNEDGDSEWFLIKDITQIVKEAPAP